MALKKHRKAKTATVTEADFTTTYSATNKPTFTFADEDKLYVQMTAENGVSVSYYAYQILIGWDAGMSKIQFTTNSNQNVSAVDVTIGQGKATVAGIEEADWGQVQFNTSGNAFKVTAVPAGAGATAVIGTDGTDFTTTANGALITFSATAENFLYVKVTSANTKGILFYKFKVTLQRSVEIPYAAVAPTIPTTIDKAAIDGALKTWWENPNNATDWLPINRQNKTETGMGNEYDQLDPKLRTFGRAKLAWDSKGIWVYGQIYENNIIATTSGQQHTQSSLELFINENAAANTGGISNASGGQYRLGAELASGNTNLTSGAPDTAVTAFRNLGKFKAASWKDGSFKTIVDPFQETDVTNGYIVLFQAPWRFTTQYPLVKDKKITIELQINAMGATTRIAVLNWNNENSNSYGSIANYGQAILTMPEGADLPALEPSISTQPAAQKVNQNAANVALSVTAATADSGTLSFQWYKAAAATAAPATDTKVGTADAGVAGTPASGVTPYTSTYTPDISTATTSDNYYYVIVTNTKGTGGNATTATRTSNVAAYRVIDPNATAVDLELVKNTHSKWDDTAGGLLFEKTGGWGNYSLIDDAIISVVTTFDADQYTSIYFEYIGYKADGTEVANYGSNQYSLDVGPRIFKASASVTDFGSNATSGPTTVVGGGCSSIWSLPTAAQSATFSDGTYTINLFAMNKANSIANGPITKLVVKSVKLIAK